MGINLLETRDAQTIDQSDFHINILLRTTKVQ